MQNSSSKVAACVLERRRGVLDLHIIYALIAELSLANSRRSFLSLRLEEVELVTPRSISLSPIERETKAPGITTGPGIRPELKQLGDANLQ